MASFTLRIITPERQVFEDEGVIHLTLPTEDGEVTILAEHVPLVSILKPGEVVIKHERGDIVPLAISGGMLHVQPNIVTVLADTAEHVTEIAEGRAAEARERAQQQLTEVRMDAESFAALAAKIEKETARLLVARKWKHLKKAPIDEKNMK